MILFFTATHLLKLEQYREDRHGPCARMTRKFVRHSKFSTITSDHAGGHTLNILPVGRVSRKSLFSASSYIEPRPTAVISCCSLVAERRSKSAVFHCPLEQSLPS